MCAGTKPMNRCDLGNRVPMPTSLASREASEGWISIQQYTSRIIIIITIKISADASWYKKNIIMWYLTLIFFVRLDIDWLLAYIRNQYGQQTANTSCVLSWNKANHSDILNDNIPMCVMFKDINECFSVFLPVFAKPRNWYNWFSSAQVHPCSST